MALWRVLDYTSATLCVAVKHPPTNSLKLGKKTKLKAERNFEFYSFYISRVFSIAFCFGRRFPAPSFFTAAKTIFQSFSSMTLLLENVKNPRKTYFNPFTLFRFRGIKPSATATDKAIRTLAYDPRKD